MQLIKDMQLEFTHASIMGQCATRGSQGRLMPDKSDASFLTTKPAG